MTNHWVDIKNTDCIFLVGSNAAENHPMSFKWIEEARKNRGAKLIVVDPRVSRSAAKADIYGRIRSGTDITFFGGLIHYVLQHGLYNEKYVKTHTNLSYVLNQFEAAMPADFNDFDGIFPGFDGTSSYTDKSTWNYAMGPSGPETDNDYASSVTDRVIDVLKKFYARYTPKMVEDVTGMDQATFLRIAEAYAATGASDKSGTIMYAMGTTQHTYGVQNIRTYAMLQLLLGNMGVAGGGINALRGESNVQGSTDMCLLSHILPGYLGVPSDNLTSLGLQPNTAALKVDTDTSGQPGFGESIVTAAAGQRVIQVSTDLDALGVRCGDRIRNTDHATDTGWYTLEAVWTDTATGLFYARVTADLAGAWAGGDDFEVDSSSRIAAGAGTYLGAKTPKGMAGTPDFYGNERTSANWWQNYPKYVVSLLAAWWGNSTNFTAPDFCYDYLPKVDASTNYSHISIFENIEDLQSSSPATPQMLMCWGQNPAVGGPNAAFERRMLANLDTLVCVDLWETETASFWKVDHRLDGTAQEGGTFGDPSKTPADIDTVVYMLPARASMEKEGSISNSGRWAQWRYAATDGVSHVQRGDAKADLDIINDLALELKNRYASATDVASGLPVRELAWGPNTFNDYGAQYSEADPKVVAKEINGFQLLNPGTATAARGSQYKSFGQLAADGSTASGNWLYCGQWVEPSDDALTAQTGPYAGNRCAKRVSVDNSASGIGLYSNWSWCWPINRRIIYNRASLEPVGGTAYAPWASDKWVIRYDYDRSTWYAGGDVPDGGWAPAAYMPFIMKPEGASHIWGTARVDGPIPEHYEPAETPLSAHPFTGGMASGSHVMHNPTVLYGTFKQYDSFVAGDAATYPHVGTTYRLVEHWQAGAMTRNLPWLAELQPDVFVEMSEELAVELGVGNGGKVKVTTVRNPDQPLRAVALVTKRFKPFTIMGQTLHQVGIPWHFGYRGVAQGSSANLLTSHIGDPNTRIPEFKAFLCKVEADT